jgi:hypothetical protein
MGIMMANCGLINAIKELNDGDPPNTHISGSIQIDIALCTEGLLEHIDRVICLDYSVLARDRKGFFANLTTAGLTWGVGGRWTT